MKKLLCLFLALFMVLPILVACKKNKQPSTDSTDETQNQIAGISQKNYDKDFTIVNPQDNVYDMYYWNEDYGNSSNIALANYKREVAIEKHLGIDIHHVTLSPDAGVLYSAFESDGMEFFTNGTARIESLTVYNMDESKNTSSDPRPEETDTAEQTTDAPAAPADTAELPTDVPAETEAPRSGCASALSGVSVMAVVGAVALALGKKKDAEE